MTNGGALDESKDSVAVAYVTLEDILAIESERTTLLEAAVDGMESV